MVRVVGGAVQRSDCVTSELDQTSFIVGVELIQ